MSHYAEKRDYCERVCRFASASGARLQDARKVHIAPARIDFSYTFHLSDGRQIAGGPAARPTEALHAACKAYADAVL